MLPNDRPQFALLMNALASAFRVECDEPMLEGYWLALDDVPLDGVQASVRAALRGCKFMPSAVELREMTGGTTAKNRAVLAFDSLSSAMATYGYYHSVNFDDPYINAAVANLGGWCRICDLPAEEFQKWFRKEFERVYAALIASGPLRNSGYLVGFFEQQNSANGHPVAPPVQIATGLPPLALPSTPAKALAERGGEPKRISSPDLAEWSR